MLNVKNGKSTQNATSSKNICQKISQVSDKNQSMQFILDNTAGYNKTPPIFTIFFFNVGLPQNPKVVIFRKISTDSIQSKAF